MRDNGGINMLIENRVTAFAPGKYNITNDEYHGSTGMSNSSLKYFVGKKACPKKYHHHYILGKDKKRTQSLELGSALHTAVLERSTWKDIYKVIQQKTVSDATRAKYAPLLPMPAQDAKKIIGMKNSILQFPFCNVILNFEKGEAEQSIYWIDEETGVLCKTRPDFLNYEINAVFDLKTTEDASPAGFPRSMAEYGYYMQAAMMIDGIKAVLGIDVTVCNFVVEKSAPHCVQPYEISSDDIAQGRYEYKEALRVYKACLEANEWPMYSKEILEIELPYWATNKFIAARAM